MRTFIGLFGVFAIALASAQSNGPKPAAEAEEASRDAAILQRLTQLQEQLRVQQEQLLKQREQIDEQERQLELLQHNLREAAGQGSANQATAAMNLQSAAASSPAPSTSKNSPEAGPTTIKFRGVSITPGGFIEADGIVRGRNQNADVIGNFSAIPFDGTANSNLSEFRSTSRASRLSMLVEGRFNQTKLSGYYEVDFLGQAPTANQVQTNGFTPRQRQLWAQAEFANGIILTGGQDWSLLTTSRKGIAVRGEYIPCTIDGAYVVGYNYARQTAFRITKKVGNTTWAAFEVANPETNQPNASYVPPNLFGFNNSTNATTPNGGTINYLYGSTNGFSTNLAPDLVTKVAWEPGWGHYEVKALGRFFRDRIDDVTNVAYGGGFGASAILPANKHTEIILEGLAGAGIGRYGAANGSDITLRPDGSIVPLRTVQILAGVEAHPNPMVDLYAYLGNEYFGRAPYVNPTDNSKPAGYGSRLVNNTNCTVEVLPAGGSACGAQNKNIGEVTAGFWHRLYKGPGGTLQYGLQYGYLRRVAWAGIGGTPQGSNHLGLTSVRYYLP